MSRTLAWMATGLSISLGLFVGCDLPPSPPSTSGGQRVKVVTVAPENAAERAAVTEYETARVNYVYRLQVLNAYYDRVGNLDKFNWSRNEMGNLSNVQTFRWDAVPEVLPPEGESIEQADERLLVEYVIGARQGFLDALGRLQAFYEQDGQSLKAALVKNSRARFDPVRTYMYFLSAETPMKDVAPTEVIPEAEQLFAEAYKLFREGKGIIPLMTTNYSKQRRALVLFDELILKYPRSTKIALSAYYMADIYKEYFNENVRAVYWYQKAWEWDLNITEPARFQAATVYDIRLHNFSKAIECYKLAIQHEQFNATNVQYAHRRIRELTEQMKTE